MVDRYSNRLPRLVDAAPHVLELIRRQPLPDSNQPASTKPGAVHVTELKRLKMLADENARLKRIVADLTLDKQILQEVVRKKL